MADAATPDPLRDRTFVTRTTTAGGVARPVVAGTEIRLTVRDGHLGAHAGCNHVGFPLTVEPARLRTGDWVTTLMFCGEDRMAQETWLTTFLAADPEWALSGDVLLLRSGDDRLELTEVVGDPAQPAIVSPPLTDST